jgi:hypothetical protein
LLSISLIFLRLKPIFFQDINEFPATTDTAPRTVTTIMEEPAVDMNDTQNLVNDDAPDVAEVLLIDHGSDPQEANVLEIVPEEQEEEETKVTEEEQEEVRDEQEREEREEEEQEEDVTDEQETLDLEPLSKRLARKLPADFQDSNRTPSPAASFTRERLRAARLRRIQQGQLVKT